MSHAIHTETIGSSTIKVYLDHDAKSPFAENIDGVALHLSFGRVGEIITPNAEQLTRETIQTWLTGGYKTVPHRPASMFQGWALFPVQAYIHGGITVSLSSFEGRVPEGHARFDSGLCGVLLLQSNPEGEYHNTVAVGKLLKRAEDLIQSVNDWLHCEVYGYEVEDANGKVVASCYGFHGDYRTSGLLEQARLGVELNAGMAGISGEALNQLAEALKRAKDLMGKHPDGLWGVRQAVSEIEVQLAAMDPENFPREDFLKKCGQEDLI